MSSASPNVASWLEEYSHDKIRAKPIIEPAPVPGELVNVSLICAVWYAFVIVEPLRNLVIML